MKQIILISVAIATLMLAASVATAQPIRPGDDILDTTLIRSGVDSLAIYIMDGDSVYPVGRLIVSTTVGDDGTITRDEEFLGFEGERVTLEQLIVADQTLRPHRFSSTGLENVEFVYGEGEVTATRDGESPTSSPLSSAVFQPKSLDLVLASLPLREGLEAQLAVFDEQTMSEGVVDIRVNRIAGVRQVEGGSRQTFEVQADFGDAVDLYHVDMQSGELIRYEASAAGVVMLRW